jgi:hypothetical protein
MMIEKRALQVIVALACLVPFYAGGLGIVNGPAFLRGVASPVPTDLDSHFRYVSGIFFGVGIGFASCIADIEKKSPRFTLLACFIIMGGLARLFSLMIVGMPSGGHMFGLGMELGVVPLLTLWQRNFARRWGKT